MTRVLVARSDNIGDVLLAGPAIRAVASASEVTLLCGPRGRAAADLLPGVSTVAVERLPWIDLESAPPAPGDLAALVARLAALDCDEAVLLTSYHQSALPLALALREAGVKRIVAGSEDFPGGLLDVRVRHRAGDHEVERDLAVAAAAGYSLPPHDDGRLSLRAALRPASPVGPDVDVVVHPGATAPTRAVPPVLARDTVRALTSHGLRVAVTGAAHEGELVTWVSDGRAQDLAGATDLTSLADVLARARCVVTGNTGPAHLAAAVGTPVVQVFAPVVDYEVWRPWGVPTERLGDQQAACQGTRARSCPVAGHTCVTGIDAADLVAAVARLSEVAA